MSKRRIPGVLGILNDSCQRLREESDGRVDVVLDVDAICDDQRVRSRAYFVSRGPPSERPAEKFHFENTRRVERYNRVRSLRFSKALNHFGYPFAFARDPTRFN